MTMSDISFFCVLCGGKLTAQNAAAGGSLECVHCGEPVPIPGGSRSQPPGFNSPEILAVEIKFLCPGCGSRLGIDSSRGGEEIHCPPCGQPVTVPHLSTSGQGREPRIPPQPDLERRKIHLLTNDEIAFLTTPITASGTRPGIGGA